MKIIYIFGVFMLLALPLSVHASSYPDGCDATTKYSSDTGHLCETRDCSPGDNFSAETGVPCTTSSFIPGCTSLNGYSTESGQLCNSTISSTATVATTLPPFNASITLVPVGMSLPFNSSFQVLNIPMSSFTGVGNNPSNNMHVVIGAIYKDANGNNEKSTDPMTVTATDSTQDKIINGSDAFDPSLNYPNGAFYYSYEYWFTSTGNHTITFSVDGVSNSVTFTVGQ